LSCDWAGAAGLVAVTRRISANHVGFKTTPSAWQCLPPRGYPGNIKRTGNLRKVTEVMG
jgi:hypothetical protein